MVYAALHDAHELVPLATDAAPGGRPGEGIALGGAPAALCADGHGHVYAGLDGSDPAGADAIAVVATVAPGGASVTAHWPLGAGHHPTGLVCDPTGARLFVACADRHLLVVDTADGSIRGDLPLGDLPGDCAWSGGAVLVACAGGSLTVARATGPGGYVVTQNLAIPRGASHLAVDAQGVVYLPAEQYPATGDTTHPIANALRLLLVARLPQLDGP
jgi:DNA-binding beta-propeller fold protein YncE